MKSDDIFKYLAGGLAAAVFIGIVIWLVRSEGERAREAFRGRSQEAGRRVREEIVEGAEAAVDKAAELPGKIIRDVTGEVQNSLLGKLDDSDSIHPGRGEPADVPFPGPTRPDSDLARGGRTVSPETGPGMAASKQPTESTRDTAEMIGELLRLGHAVAKSLDDAGQEVLRLSLEEEQAIGRDVHNMILQEHNVLGSPELFQGLERLVRPFLELRARKDLPLAVVILDDPEVNAFSHVGGYVYATRGMLGFAETDAELQFVLGHEIGHIDLGHCAKQVTYAMRAAEIGGELGGTLAQMAYMAIALGYSEEQEFEADAWAFRSMLAMGQSRQEATSALHHAARYHREVGLDTDRGDPRNVAEKTIHEIENHFRSHPSPGVRLKRLESLKLGTTTARMTGPSSQ